MPNDKTNTSISVDDVIAELIEIERQYYFEKRNVKTERIRKIKELIERKIVMGACNDIK